MKRVLASGVQCGKFSYVQRMLAGCDGSLCNTPICTVYKFSMHGCMLTCIGMAVLADNMHTNVRLYPAVQRCAYTISLCITDAAHTASWLNI